MHFEEGRISRQLGMKINVLENAVNQLIKIVSQITLDNQRIQRSLDKLSKGAAAGGAICHGDRRVRGLRRVA